MKSLICIGFIATLAATGCDKHDAVPAAEAAPAVSAQSKAAAPPVAPPVAPPAEKETVSKTGVLDVEMAETTGHYMLRDDAYEIVFPLRPKVDGADQPAANGIMLKTLSALANTNDDIYGFFLIPIPKGMPYDVEKGLSGARDGAIGNINGKLISETASTFGGIKGRKSLATATVDGREIRLELYLAFDKPHYTMVGLFTASFEKDTPQKAKDYVASFKVKPGKAPPTK